MEGNKRKKMKKKEINAWKLTKEKVRVDSYSRIKILNEPEVELYVSTRSIFKFYRNITPLRNQRHSHLKFLKAKSFKHNKRK